jgi:hypothetical protein
VDPEQGNGGWDVLRPIRRCKRSRELVRGTTKALMGSVLLGARQADAAVGETDWSESGKRRVTTRPPLRRVSLEAVRARSSSNGQPANARQHRGSVYSTTAVNFGRGGASPSGSRSDFKRRVCRTSTARGVGGRRCRVYRSPRGQTVAAARGALRPGGNRRALKQSMARSRFEGGRKPPTATTRSAKTAGGGGQGYCLLLGRDSGWYRILKCMREAQPGLEALAL